MNVDEKRLKEAYEAAEYLKRLKDRTNDCFWPLLFDEHKIMVLKGGGGSGKSILAGSKILERCWTERPHRFLVCRKVGKDIEGSCFNQLKGQLSDYYPDKVLGRDYKINSSNARQRILFSNGNEIVFSGLSDVEQLKSIYNITGVWIEEASEITRADFNQLNIRLRGATKNYKQIILTFNPVSMNHWLKSYFFDRKDPDAVISETTYKDNRFAREEDIRVLEGFKETDPYYYAVYCLGQWGTTGNTVFNASLIQERISKLKKPIKTGVFTYDYDGVSIKNIEFKEADDGFISIYEDSDELAPYVIGADTAGTGSDFNAAQVLNNVTGSQAAVLHKQFDEVEFTRQLYCLGMYYNKAKIACEVNFSTYPVRELSRLNYPEQYVRERLDSYTKQLKKDYGWVTDRKSRALIIAELIGKVKADVSKINDKATLEEMLTFVRNEEFRPEAEKGSHDDLVMSLAIANHIRPTYSQEFKESKIERVKWRADMWDDYYAASEEERQRMIEVWGEPE